MSKSDGLHSDASNRMYDGTEAETRKFQARFQII